MKLRLIACAAMAFARAYAQETAPIVQVKANADTVRREDTASRIVVNREEILRFGDSSALDVMRRLPGVTVVGGAPRLRGLGAGYTQLLVNGERPAPGFTLDTLSPDMIERIEIMRATTAEFSAQSVAGTINIILRKPPAKRSREWKARLGIPPYYSVREASLALGDKDEKLAYTVNASLANIVNKRTLSATTRQFDADGRTSAVRRESDGSTARGDILNVNSRVVMTIAEGEKLSWNTFGTATFFRFDRDTQAHVDQGPAYPYGRLGFWRKDVTGNLRTELTWSRQSADGGRLDASFGLNAGDGRRDRKYTGDSPQGEALLARSYDTDPDSRGAATKGKYTWPAMSSHIFSAGWDAERSRQREHEVQRDVLFTGAEPIDFDRRTSAHLERFAFYAQDEWAVAQSVSLYTGLRRETGITRTAASDAAPASNRASQTSPTLQALWKMQGEPRRQLRAAFVASYKAPEVVQLVPRRFLSLVNTEIEPDTTGNPGLRPETARGFDLSFEAYGKDDGLLSLSAGTRRIRNVILNVVQLDSGRWVSSPRNQGNAQTHSLELEWKQALAGTPWKYSFNAARHWSHVEAVPGPDNRLARQPGWSATAGVEYRSGPWSGGATLTATAAGWSRVSAMQSIYNGGQRDLRTYISYRLVPQGILRVSASNLLRQAEREGNAYRSAGGGIQRQAREYLGPGLWVDYSRQF
jgi:outer membrane receptor for ferrienterochelin and colicins